MSIPPTYVDYTATAAQTDFAFSFEYLEDEHVTVFIDGVQQTLNTDFTIVTTPTKKIVLTSGATAGQIVRVRRQSQRDTDLVDFENGSVLTERELDRAYQHNRYLHQEIGELNDASLQKAPGTNDWDAGGSKIINVGTPTLTADATTKDYVDAKVNQASTGSSFPPTKWVFTGTAGANTTYSVTGAEVNGDTAYDVSVDGSVLEPTTDYTVDPDTDTLTIVNTLSGGEDIVVIERGFGVAISTGSIGEDQLQTNSVSTAKIQNDAVDNSKIADDAVDTTKIADDAVDNSKIADNAVDTAQLADHSVIAVKISNTDPIFNVQTTGEVGIGIPNPNVALEVNGGVDNSVVFRGRCDSDPSHTGSGAGNNGRFNLVAFSSDAGNDYGGGIKIQTRDGLNVFHDRMTIDEGGLVGIGTDSPSAPLDVTSTTGGVVFPRLTTAQRTAIGSPTDGETIFNTDTNQVESWNGSSWGATGGVSKYSTGWSTSIPSANSDVTYTHSLGTEDITYKVYVRDSSNNEHDITGGEVWAGVTNANCSCVDITSTQITIRFFKTYLDWTTATAGTNPTSRAWTTATNIKVVVIG